MDASQLLDKVPVNSLYPDRYGFAKSKVYEFLRALGIRSTRQGKIAYITLDELQTLDKYCWLLQNNGDQAASEFAKSVHGSFQQNEQPTLAPLRQSPAWLLLEQIASQFQPPAPDPLEPQAQLQRIASAGWEVSSSQLRQILGISNLSDRQRRYGFEFHKVGRIGRQAAWRVIARPLFIQVSDSPSEVGQGPIAPKLID